MSSQNRLDPNTSAFAADQQAMPIHSLRFCSGHTVPHCEDRHSRRADKMQLLKLAGSCLAVLSLVACTAQAPTPATNQSAAPAAAPTPSGGVPGTVALPTGFPERPFVRVQFDKLTWRPTEGNKLGV